MKQKVLLILVIVFSIMGIFLAGSLTAAKYSDNIAVLCGEDLDNSCNTVQNSEYSYLINVKNDDGSTKFQFPLTLAGLLFYIILLIGAIILLKDFRKRKEDKKLKIALFIVGLIGILFSIVYTWIQAYKIEAFCTYCLISAANSVILFILLIFIAFGDKICKKKKKPKM
jgi:uncharacterized membrane protein